MTTIHIHATVERDGEVYVSNLPVKRGQVVELQIQVAPESFSENQITLAAKEIRLSIIRIIAIFIILSLDLTVFS